MEKKCEEKEREESGEDTDRPGTDTGTDRPWKGSTLESESGVLEDTDDEKMKQKMIRREDESWEALEKRTIREALETQQKEDAAKRRLTLRLRLATPPPREGKGKSARQALPVCSARQPEGKGKGGKEMRGKGKGGSPARNSSPPRKGGSPARPDQSLQRLPFFASNACYHLWLFRTPGVARLCQRRCVILAGVTCASGAALARARMVRI